MQRCPHARLLLLLLLLLIARPTPSAAQPKPTDTLVGELRVTGAKDMEPLLAAWAADFERQHSRVRIVPNIKGRASAVYGLEMRTADIALMDRAIYPFERYGTYERSWTYPVAIEVGTGSATAARHAPAYAIFVHPSNPLRRLTLEQLDGIFGARRDGGWDKLVWNKSAARGSDRDIRTWGQLGLRGPLANQPIHPYGAPLQGQGAVTDFQNLVLQGGATWNDEYREYDDPRQMFAALADDPLGIAYGAIGDAPTGMVPLAIARTSRGPFVEPSPTSVASRTYPLARPIYLYFTIDTPSGDPARVKPLIRAFARYVVSPEGQSVVSGLGAYTPLPSTIATRQQAKIASDAWPVERPKP